jgi:hypothetical protein
MTCVNTSAFFESPIFFELANEEIDRLPQEYLKEVHTRFINDIYLGKDSSYDFGMLNSLNTGGVSRKYAEGAKFNEEYIQKYKDTMEKFYKS